MLLVLIRRGTYIRDGDCRAMVTREELVAELQRVPEKHLGELYRIIKSYEGNGDELEPSENVMAKLREIKISASSDFSMNANLYNLDNKDAR